MLNNRGANEEKRMTKFRSSMRAAVYWNEKMIDLQKFDIIMFPVLEYIHYYLVAFELKYPSICVIDNAGEKHCVPIVDSRKYFEKDTPYKIKDMLVKYLREIKHPRVEIINELQIHREKLDWATSYNVDDYGVFLTRHKEKFMGKGERFEAGFSTNGSKKLGEVNLSKGQVEAACLR